MVRMTYPRHNPKAKLTPDDVRRARELAQRGNLTPDEINTMLGNKVSSRQMMRILRGEAWPTPKSA